MSIALKDKFEVKNIMEYSKFRKYSVGRDMYYKGDYPYNNYGLKVDNVFFAICTHSGARGDAYKSNLRGYINLLPKDMRSNSGYEKETYEFYKIWPFNNSNKYNFIYDDLEKELWEQIELEYTRDKLQELKKDKEEIKSKKSDINYEEKRLLEEGREVETKKTMVKEMEETLKSKTAKYEKFKTVNESYSNNDDENDQEFEL